MLYAKEPLSAAKSSRPLLFIENKGQITDQNKQERKDIDFKLDGGGVSIFVGAGQIHYQWYQYMGKPGDSNMQVNAYRMDVQLIGANPNAPLQKEEADNYYENYYSPRLKDGVTAKSYRRMVYKNVYPQIDWVIYTKGQSLKYDFVVHKGGNPADIQLQYNGATGTELKNGAFTATTPMGSITEEKPYSYEADTKKPVASAYKLQDGVLSFDVRKQDADIVIDPNLVWATYYGGSQNERGVLLVADKSDKVYMGGITNSSNNIITTGAYSSTFIALQTSFIACLNDSCVRQWGTYFGYNFLLTGLAIDTTLEALYVAGYTDSPGNATTGAHQTIYAGRGDAYLARFTLTGFRQWATYYGGDSTDGHYSSVAVDKNSNLILFGSTISNNNIATVGANMTSRSVLSSAFLAKFNAMGIRQWGTYVIGNSTSYSLGSRQLELDKFNNIYINSEIIGISATMEDINISKYSSTGNPLWQKTYGGVYNDMFLDMAVDNAGCLYVCGITASATGIATPGSFRDTVYRANSSTTIGPMLFEGFLIKLDSAGKKVWGTYIGDSTVANAVYNVAISYDNEVYIQALSAINVVSPLITPDAFQPNRAGSYDVIFAKFDTAGKHHWGSYYGGNAVENDQFGNNLNAIAITPRYLYASGFTSSTSGIAYGSNIHQPSYGGADDNYIIQISLDTVVQIQPFIDTVLCPGDSVKVKTKVNFPFRTTNVFTVQLSNANGSFASPTVIGTKTANGNDSVMCFVPRSTPAGNGYRIRIIASAPADTSEDNGINIRIKPLPTAVVASSNAPICATDTLRLSGSSGNTDVTYSWMGVAGFVAGVKDTFRAAATTAHTGNYILTVNRQGCIVKDTTYVLVKPRPDTPDASSNSPVCTGATINLTGTNNTSGVSYIWNGPSGFSSTAQSPARTGAITAYSGIYRVYTSLNGCASLFYDSTSITVYPITAPPVPTANTPLCLGQDLQLGAGIIPGASYVWSGPGGFSSTLQTPLRASSTAAFAGKYYVQAIVNGCISSPDSIAVAVNAAPNITMYPSPKDSICERHSVTFVSSTSNAGSSYTRNWFRNNTVIGGAANANYSTATAADGDEYYTTITVYGVCATPYTDTSNIIKMHVLPYLVPTVSIAANPNTTVKSGTMINFAATPTNGGSRPAYQWLVNGSYIIGAISNVWGASTLSNNDVICAEMTSSYMCANPKKAKSDCIKVSIESTGIVGVWRGKEPSIYPNPTSDRLIIEGIEKGTRIQLTDVLGSVVIKATATSETTELNMSHLAAGNYMLLLSTDNGDRMSVKVVKE